MTIELSPIHTTVENTLTVLEANRNGVTLCLDYYSKTILDGGLCTEMYADFYLDLAARHMVLAFESLSYLAEVA